MKKIFCVIFGLLLVFVGCENDLSSNVLGSEFSQTNTFVTTDDSSRYSRFITSEQTIQASGFYKGDVVADFELNGTLFASQSLDFKAEPDGSYTAAFTGVPTGENAYIVISLESGVVLRYRVNYNDNGWYFIDNGLGNLHTKTVENNASIPAEITAQYLAGEEGTRQEAVDTLNGIRAITEQVVDRLPDNSDDYDKAKAISAWVAENIYYDRNARDNYVDTETIALKNVISSRKTVCVGYANLTAAMLEVIGLDAVTVIGSTTNISTEDVTLVTTENNHHEWTAFWYEKEKRWVLLDSGWDSYNYYQNSYEDRPASRKYFDITPLALSQDHRAIKAESRRYFEVVSVFYDGADSDDSPDSTDDADADNPDNSVDGTILNKPPNNPDNLEVPIPTQDGGVRPNPADTGDNPNSYDPPPYLNLILGAIAAVGLAAVVILIIVIVKNIKNNKK